LNPSAVRGLMKQPKSPEASNEEKATNSIEGIGDGLLNAGKLKAVIRIIELSNLGHAMHKTGDASATIFVTPCM